MPKYEETIVLTSVDRDTALALTYEAFTTLGWTAKFSGESTLLAITPKQWKQIGEQVSVNYDAGRLHITSSMINGELIAPRKRNKNNVIAFVEAFAVAKQNLTEENTAEKKNAVVLLHQQNEKDYEIAVQEAEEVNKVMKTAGSNLFVTYAIILINIIVFALMAYDGAGLFEPNGLVHIKWGSNYSPLTLSGDWWRLLTCTFLHFGMLHLAMNMYCLYTIGVYLEPMLGKVKYITAYLATGIFSSLVSLWWHNEPANSAGASGAVFGLYGLFLALLTTDLIPKSVRSSLLQSIGIFIAFNLFYGMKSGVDNSAHVGGLVSGFAIGYLYVISIRKEREGLKISWMLPLVIVASIAIPFLYLDKHKVTPAERNSILAEIKEGSYADNDKFDETYNQFIEHQKTAMDIFKDTAANEGIIKEKITSVAAPQWEQAELLAKQMQRMNVSGGKHKKADAVLVYILLRKEEIAMYINVLNNISGSSDKLEEIRKQIDETVEKING
jgi:rhomboid protease GluP